jgi:hypothetical protein
LPLLISPPLTVPIAPQSLRAPTSSGSSRHAVQKQKQAPALPKPSSPTPSTPPPKTVSLKAKNSPIKFSKSSTAEKVTFAEEALPVKPTSQASPSGKQSPGESRSLCCLSISHSYVSFSLPIIQKRPPRSTLQVVRLSQIRINAHDVSFR